MDKQGGSKHRRESVRKAGGGVKYSEQTDMHREVELPRDGHREKATRKSPNSKYEETIDCSCVLVESCLSMWLLGAVPASWCFGMVCFYGSLVFWCPLYLIFLFLFFLHMFSA